MRATRVGSSWKREGSEPVRLGHNDGPDLYPRVAEQALGGADITADTDATDREGIGVCQVLVTRLGMVFREQSTSDFGVDAQVEMKRDGHPTGRLVGLQIKSGPSRFEEPYDEASMIAPDVQALAQATAAAVRDLSSGLPALRVLSDTDEMAAAKMTSLLADAGRLDDAQGAAQAAYSRFGDPGFLVEAAAFLMRLGRPGDASAAASEALAQSSLDAFGRRTAHRILARIAVQEAESTAGSEAPLVPGAAPSLTSRSAPARRPAGRSPRCLESHPRPAEPGRSPTCRRHLVPHNPEVTSKYEAELWARVFVTQPGDVCGTQQDGRMVREQRFSVLRPCARNRSSPGPGYQRAPGRAGPLREAGARPVQDSTDLGPADQHARRARHRGRGSLAGANCARKGARPVSVERRCHPAEPRPGLRRRRLRNRHPPAIEGRRAPQRPGRRRCNLRGGPNSQTLRGNDGPRRARSRRIRRRGDAHRAGTPRGMEGSRPRCGHSRTWLCGGP